MGHIDGAEMAEDRKSNGQFAEGWKGGPGRPKRATEERYLRWTVGRVKRADWITIVDVAVARAKAGDHQARQWLSDYLMGKPKQLMEVTGAGGGPIIVVSWDDTAKPSED